MYIVGLFLVAVGEVASILCRKVYFIVCPYFRGLSILEIPLYTIHLHAGGSLREAKEAWRGLTVWSVYKIRSNANVCLPASNAQQPQGESKSAATPLLPFLKMT